MPAGIGVGEEVVFFLFVMLFLCVFLLAPITVPPTGPTTADIRGVTSSASTGEAPRGRTPVLSLGSGSGVLTTGVPIRTPIPEAKVPAGEAGTEGVPFPSEVWGGFRYVFCHFLSFVVFLDSLTLTAFLVLRRSVSVISFHRHVTLIFRRLVRWTSLFSFRGPDCRWCYILSVSVYCLMRFQYCLACFLWSSCLPLCLLLSLSVVVVSRTGCRCWRRWLSKFFVSVVWYFFAISCDERCALRGCYLLFRDGVCCSL